MIVAALGHNAVFLLLLQLATLLVVARLCALFARAIGLPSVVGELAAGIVLGPSVLGHFAPGLSTALFPEVALHLDLLDVVGTVGMVLLLLLTGIETDLRLLRNLGRPALVASAMGMAVPFALGFVLGLVMPDAYLAEPDRRVLFSSFLATAMAISAMPVIAKILMDLDLTRRNVGLVILSAGVVDDTAGWLILSVIAGAATRGGAAAFGGVLLALGLTLVFLLLAVFVLYPLLRVLLRLVATRVRAPDTDLVLIVAVTLLCAAATEQIGVHAVFGAFVCGTLLRQVPHLARDTVHRLESFVFPILAPVFFGTVGLKVDLWSLAGGGGAMLGAVLSIACLGKLVGCTLGSLWGGLRFWESVSIAVAMNARGAMELVVATIGLSLGILNQQMFSIIVVVAIATSFMAPILLRLTMRMVKMSDEEARRLLLEASKGVWDPAHLRVLVPTAAGPNALEAARIGLALARRSDSPPEVLFVDVRPSWWRRLRNPFAKTETGRNLEQHLTRVRALAEDQTPPRVRTVVGRSVPRVVIDQVSRGVDLVLIGATGRGTALGGPVLEEIVVGAPCHLAIVRAGSTSGQRYSRVVVLADGSLVVRVAVELALRYAEATGASLTLALSSEGEPALPAPPSPEREGPDGSGMWRAPNAAAIAAVASSAPAALGADEELARISPVFRASETKPEILRLRHDPEHTALLEAIEERGYDLVVIGVENRAIQHRLFFGHDAERLIERTPVTLAVVVPNLSKLR